MDDNRIIDLHFIQTMQEQFKAPAMRVTCEIAGHTVQITTGDYPRHEPQGSGVTPCDDYLKREAKP